MSRAAIPMLAALFDRLQLQVADELAKRLTELGLASSTNCALAGSKKLPSETSSAAVVTTIFASFPRRCAFYYATLSALLKFDDAASEAIIKVLLMWQPRHYVGHVALSPKNGDLSFGALVYLVEPLRHLDRGWREYIAAHVEVMIAEFLRHVLVRHKGELSISLLDKLMEAFTYYTKPLSGGGKYSGPDSGTFLRLKSESSLAWVVIYGSISARVSIEEVSLLRAVSPEEILCYRMVSLERVGALAPALQFMERIAAASTAAKKTKLKTAYLLCLERAAASIDVQHEGWPPLSARVSALYRRARKWAKTPELQIIAGPLAAVLLLRSSLSPGEMLLFIAKRIKELQNEQTTEASLRTLLALLRGSTREFELPTEILFKGDKKRSPYASASLYGHSIANAALGVILEAFFGHKGVPHLSSSPLFMDLAVELLLQVAAHDTKLFFFRVQMQLEASTIDQGELQLILRTLSRMADPASSFWKAAAYPSSISKEDKRSLVKTLQASLLASVTRVFSLESASHATHAFDLVPPPSGISALRMLHDVNGASLNHAVLRAFQRCEARLARNTETVSNKESVKILDVLSSYAVKVQLATPVDSFIKRAATTRAPSGVAVSRERTTKSATGLVAKFIKGERTRVSALLQDALRALPLLGSAVPFGEGLESYLFHPEEEIALACSSAMQRIVIHSPADRSPLFRRFVDFIRRLSPEHDALVVQSAVSHLLALVDLCLVAPYVVLDSHQPLRSRCKMTLFEQVPADTRVGNSSIALELEALAATCLCHPTSAVRVDAVALLDSVGYLYPSDVAPASANSELSATPAPSSSSSSPSPTSLQLAPAMLLGEPTQIPAQALATFLSEAWPSNEYPVPELSCSSLSLSEIAQSGGPLLWIYVLRNIASLMTNSRSLTAVWRAVIDATQKLLDNSGSDCSTFGIVLRANLSALMLALPHPHPQEGLPSIPDMIDRWCASAGGALNALAAENETGSVLDAFSAALGGAHPTCVVQVIHSVSTWYTMEFSRLGQKRATRARHVLSGAFRRLVCNHVVDLQSCEELLPFLVSFIFCDDLPRAASWDSLQHLCELTSLLAAVAEVCATHEALTPSAEQRCRLLLALHRSVNPLQDSAVVSGLIEKADVQRRELKDGKVAAKRQVEAALELVHKSAWRAVQALLQLGPLDPEKITEVCSEAFMNWCLDGERNGVPILRWFLAHHRAHFISRFTDRCYFPPDAGPLFTRAILEQFRCDPQMTARGEAISVGAVHPRFAMHSLEEQAQLLALFLQETGAAEVESRNRALGVIVHLATQLSNSDASLAAKMVGLRQVHCVALASPQVETWRTAAKLVLNVVADCIAQAIAAPLLCEIVNRWKHVSTARREWLLELLLPYAYAMRLGLHPDSLNLLRRLLTEAVLSAPLPTSPALSALWLGLLTSTADNCAHVSSFLISCGSEARHIREASRFLLVDLYCSAPELVAAQLIERLTCDSAFSQASNETCAQDAVAQREAVCDILVEVATATAPPSALSPYLPVLIAYALPRIGAAECVPEAQRLLGCVCEIVLAGGLASTSTEADVRGLCDKFQAPTRAHLWWAVESSLEPAMVLPDVPAPVEKAPVHSCLSGVQVLKTLSAVLSPVQSDALSAQLTGWALQHPDLRQSLRAQELFLAVQRPQDATAINMHVFALQEVLGDLEHMPQPATLPKPSDVLFSQRRTKALLVLRALQAAAQEAMAAPATASAELLQKLFWSAAAVLDVPSPNFAPLLDAALPLMTSVIRHPVWRSAAEQHVCVGLGTLGAADFGGILWPLLKAIYTGRSEYHAFTLLCTLLEFQVPSEVLLRLSSSPPHLSASLAALPWLVGVTTRQSSRTMSSSSLSSTTVAHLLSRALTPYKDSAELSQLLSSGDVRTEGFFKAAVAALSHSSAASLAGDAAPLLIQLCAFAPLHNEAISRLCRALLTLPTTGSLFLCATKHVLRAPLVYSSPIAFESLVRLSGRILRSSPTVDDSADALVRTNQLQSRLSQSRRDASMTRLFEAVPALAAGLQFKLRRKSVVATGLDEGAQAELLRLAAQYCEEAKDSANLKELQLRSHPLGTPSMTTLVEAAKDVMLEGMLLSGGCEENEDTSANELQTSTIGTTASMVRLVDAAKDLILEDTRELDEEDEAEMNADRADLDALIRAAQHNFKGFDSRALADATTVLTSLTGSSAAPKNTP